MAPTYSFQANNVAYSGPGGSFTMEGAEDEGISIEQEEASVTRKVGPDGNIMFVLMAGKPGVATVRIMKNSPTNAQIAAAFATEISDPENVGQATLSVSNSAMGIQLNGTSCSIERLAACRLDKGGAGNEWRILIGKLTGTP